MDKPEAVRIDFREHKASEWVSPREALSGPLMLDLDSCIDLYYKISRE